MESTKAAILAECKEIFPAWRGLPDDNFLMEDPKGFSSFTLSIFSKVKVEPEAVLYRRLSGKENAILDFKGEKEIFQLLGEHHIAAKTYYYDQTCRIESFYRGKTLEARDVFNPDILRKIANELFRFHQLTPANLPEQTFFDLLFNKWGKLAAQVLQVNKHIFPENEQAMCDEMIEIYQPSTLEKVKRFLPTSSPVFCHNDTYHGNIMRLNTGEIKLLDFEFSCLNHKAFDFANLFAETVMEHRQPDPPFFRIAEPSYTAQEINLLVEYYLDNSEFSSLEERAEEKHRLVQATIDMIPLSDFMYAMAALPLALEPIQKIRFIPYAHQRFTKFKDNYHRRFG